MTHDLECRRTRAVSFVVLLGVLSVVAPGACCGTSTSYPVPAWTAGARVPTGTTYHPTYFTYHGTNPRVCAHDDARSTFEVDVDDGSYLLARAYLRRHQEPERDGVRVEEFVNHFDYGYPRPTNRAVALVADGAPSPFDPQAHLLRFAVQGAEVTRAGSTALSLVFLIDTSGSMNREGRLRLVKDGLLHLVEHLAPEDRVTVVGFADRAVVALRPTPARYRSRIEKAVRGLRAGGNTNVADGLTVAYRMAGRIDVGSDVTRRIVLCSDGVSNTGETDLRVLEERVRAERDGGIALSVVGVGLANYDDTLLERIADVGNGVYTYLDAQPDIERTFGRAFLRSAPLVARDVRIQVEFDPRVVLSWRLLGYENRQVGDSDFRDPETDGGALVAGGSATALYEVRLRAEARASIATFRVVYEDAVTGRHEEAEYVVPADTVACSFSRAAPDFKLAAAAAAFAEILRGSPHAENLRLDNLREIAREVDGDRSLKRESRDLLDVMELAIALRWWS